MKPWITSIFRAVTHVVTMNVIAQIAFKGVILLCVLTVAGCQPDFVQIEPIIATPSAACQLSNPPAPFPKLILEERKEAWSRELVLGSSFAQEQDFYRAITCYKRAFFLVPAERPARKQQIEYSIILSYYLGEKYADVIDNFEKSSLTDLSADFPAARDLLIILYDAYQKTGTCEKADQIWEQLNCLDPTTAENLSLSSAILRADLCYLQTVEPEFTLEYGLKAKSVNKARQLNAVLPGAGYYYVGQKQTALTSFVINSLFIAAAWHFFDQGNVAAGLITTSLEAGWYLGGINGAGIAAREYNERLYEILAKDKLTQQRLFPTLMLQYTF